MSLEFAELAKRHAQGIRAFDLDNTDELACQTGKTEEFVRERIAHFLLYTFGTLYSKTLIAHIQDNSLKINYTALLKKADAIFKALEKQSDVSQTDEMKQLLKQTSFYTPNSVPEMVTREITLVITTSAMPAQFFSNSLGQPKEIVESERKRITDTTKRLYEEVNRNCLNKLDYEMERFCIVRAGLYDKKCISWFDLLTQWRHDIAKRFTLRNHIQNISLQEPNSNDGSFRDFVIAKSLSALETNLGITFDSSFKTALTSFFQEREDEERIDACFYTRNQLKHLDQYKGSDNSFIHACVVFSEFVKQVPDAYPDGLRTVIKKAVFPWIFHASHENRKKLASHFEEIKKADYLDQISELIENLALVPNELKLPLFCYLLKLTNSHNDESLNQFKSLLEIIGMMPLEERKEFLLALYKYQISPTPAFGASIIFLRNLLKEIPFEKPPSIEMIAWYAQKYPLMKEGKEKAAQLVNGSDSALLANMPGKDCLAVLAAISSGLISFEHFSCLEQCCREHSIKFTEMDQIVFFSHLNTRLPIHFTLRASAFNIVKRFRIRYPFSDLQTAQLFFRFLTFPSVENCERLELVIKDIEQFIGMSLNSDQVFYLLYNDVNSKQLSSIVTQAYKSADALLPYLDDMFLPTDKLQQFFKHLGNMLVFSSRQLDLQEENLLRHEPVSGKDCNDLAFPSTLTLIQKLMLTSVIFQSFRQRQTVDVMLETNAPTFIPLNDNQKYTLFHWKLPADHQHEPLFDLIYFNRCNLSTYRQQIKLDIPYSMLGHDNQILTTLLQLAFEMIDDMTVHPSQQVPSKTLLSLLIRFPKAVPIWDTLSPKRGHKKDLEKPFFQFLSTFKIASRKAMVHLANRQKLHSVETDLLPSIAAKGRVFPNGNTPSLIPPHYLGTPFLRQAYTCTRGVDEQIPQILSVIQKAISVENQSCGDLEYTKDNHTILTAPVFISFVPETNQLTLRAEIDNKSVVRSFTYGPLLNPKDFNLIKWHLLQLKSSLYEAIVI